MSARGTYRAVYSILVDHPEFRALSSRARHTLLTMRLSDYVGIACLWRYDVARIARQTGYTPHQTEAALTELDAAGWTQRDGELMWITHGLRHDPSVTASSMHHHVAIQRVVDGLPRCALLRRFCKLYGFAYPMARPIAYPPKGDLPPIPNRNRNRNRKEARIVDNSTGPDLPLGGETATSEECHADSKLDLGGRPDPAPGSDRHANGSKGQQLKALARHHGLTPDQLAAEVARRRRLS